MNQFRTGNCDEMNNDGERDKKLLTATSGSNEVVIAVNNK